MSLLIAGAPFLILLYSRIGATDALTHDTRARLHAYLATRPGASRRELCDALDAHPMTLVHHLHVLTSLGLVVARREGREVLYHVATAPPRAHPALRARPRREIAGLLASQPRTQREISEATGFSQRLVAYHLARLAPLLEASDVRPRRYRLREEAVGMVQESPMSDRMSPRDDVAPNDHHKSLPSGSTDDAGGRPPDPLLAAPIHS